MKEIKNISIFFFFLFCYLFRGSMEQLWIKNVNLEFENQASEVIIQNLKEELAEMSQKFQMDLLEEQLQFSKVIYRDPYHFFDRITILKGKEEGITPSAAVMDGKNLIGIVEEVQNHTSRVKLLTNPNTNLSVKINDAYGILKTNKEKECWIEDFSKNITVMKEQEVLTSGFTEIPGNILIGTVDKIEMSDLGTIQRIKIKLNSDFQNLNYISILKKENIE